MNRFIVICVLHFLFSSCETYIDIEIPTLPQKPVVNCLFEAGEPFHIRLSFSCNLDNQTDMLISGASIKLYANKTLIETLVEKTKGNYYSIYKAQEQTRYSIEITINNYATITATDSLPANVPVKNVFLEEKGILTQYGEWIPAVKFSIKDPGLQKNYYETQFISNGSIDNIQYWLIDDQVFLSEEIVGWINSIPFSDKMFNGALHEFVLPVEIYDYEEKKLYLRCNTTSETYNKYKQTLDEHLFNQGGWLYDGIFVIDGGNRVTMFSNIYNGYGIFAGYSSQLFEITDIR